MVANQLAGNTDLTDRCGRFDYVSDRSGFDRPAWVGPTIGTWKRFIGLVVVSDVVRDRRS